ncbi:MAG: hypothetical protein AAB692_03280 [Patescibacteria group bacterium]
MRSRRRFENEARLEILEGLIEALETKHESARRRRINAYCQTLTAHLPDNLFSLERALDLERRQDADSRQEINVQ